MVDKYIVDQIAKGISIIDKELNYKIFDSFLKIPFNLVDDEYIEKRKEMLNDKYCKYLNSGANHLRSLSHEFFKYKSYLEESFLYHPTCLLVDKGLSSPGKELLICAEGGSRNLLQFLPARVIFPLCINALKAGHGFPITKHPLYPVFQRYMEIPIAVAMTLAAIERIYGQESYEYKELMSHLRSAPINYCAGITLYKYGLDKRWMDWRDNKNRCQGKTEAIMKWIDVIAGFNNEVNNERVIKALWSELFGVTMAELLTARFAPVICRSRDLYSLMCDFLRYVNYHKDKFKKENIEISTNYFSRIIQDIIYWNCPIQHALQRVPEDIRESDVSAFVSRDLPEWSFSKEIDTEEYSIYGPVTELSVGEEVPRSDGKFT